MILSNVILNDKVSSVILEDKKIAAIVEGTLPDGVDCGGLILIPGLIDVHTHGYLGYDTMDADLAPLCHEYAMRGTTSFLPTTLTMPKEALVAVCDAERNHPGAHVLGIHLEGPYINMKYKGGQNPAYVRNPSMEEFSAYKGVKMISLAPECEGALEFISAITPDCIVALGHTDCTYEQAMAAFDAGANCLTHTFNAMPPMLHRAPGPIGAACERGMYAQLICDGFHVQRGAVLTAYRMFGPERLTLISDSIRPAGLPDGMADSGGLAVRIENKKILLADAPTIAGCYNCLFENVKCAISFGIPFTDAVRMATETPAALLGVNKGRVAVSYDADLLLVTPDFDLKGVVIDGEFYRKDF